jgi:hypothetical protein
MHMQNYYLQILSYYVRSDIRVEFPKKEIKLNYNEKKKKITHSMSLSYRLVKRTYIKRNNHIPLSVDEETNAKTWEMKFESQVVWF